VELSHYNYWGKYSEQQFRPNLFKVLFYLIISRFIGLTFGVRLMEKHQKPIKKLYQELSGQMEGLDFIIKDENEHESMHIDEIDEERLKFMGSIVLGLNDALVEFTGAIAGITFALGNASTIALAGLIAGIAASLSMASSEYLSIKQESNFRFALVSSIYTGVAYILAIMLMILPYLILSNVYICLGIMIGVVIFIIFIFNYYISIAKNLNFVRRFFEMVSISLGVAMISFLIGFIVRQSLGLDI
jgi:VIT1/CCC1 family predicted Fe2+/Mn2+ transporter